MYILSLDSLRGIAVMFVVYYHWFPNIITKVIPLGSIGVDIFFVLSGFLISGILLDKKFKVNNKIREVAFFFVRRCLRIFPLYYGIIIGLFFFSSIFPNPVPNYWVYFVFYLQNFLFFDLQSFIGGKVAHLWSLAVEEQFYLVWPWVILYIDKRYLHSVFLIGIFLGVFCSIYFPNYLYKGNPLVSVNPLTCIQSFCIGGYLSYLIRFSLISNSVEKFIKLLALLSIALYFLIKIFFPELLGFDRTLISFFAVWIIYSLVSNKYDKFKLIFNSSILIFIGKISYGIYIFHNFIPLSVKALFHFLSKKFPAFIFFRINPEENLLLFFSICFFVLIVISYYSFKFYEKPFISLKKYFK
ncbi:MAG: acyltransferase [Algoriphagus sp.]|nr:acyltransferase [Algoriphagus sp.]